MTEQGKPKRKRGAQPGNCNARKHGLYADGLTPEQAERFWDSVRQGNPMDKAFMYIKVWDALRQDPGNPRLIEDCVRVFTKYYVSRNQYTPDEVAEVRRTFRGLVEYVAKNFQDSPGTNQAQNRVFVSDSPERIDPETPIPIPSSASEKREVFKSHFENENE